MNKKRTIIWLVLCFVFISIMIGIIIGAIYKKYYKIDFSDYHSCYLVAAADSPDKEHSVGVWAYKTDKKSDELYVCMVLYWAEKDNSLQDGKIILWDKVVAAEYESYIQELDAFQYSIYAEWIDNENIQTAGRVVNINKGYDYRRD